MKKILFSMITIASLSYGNGCVLVQPDDINVTWKAYKTLAKLGVSGQFTGVKYTPHQKEGKNFRDLFVGSTVSIDLSKIDTHNEGRDKTLVQYFFAKLKEGSIQGKIVDIQADKTTDGKRAYRGVVTVDITMNQKTLRIPMRYHYKEGNFNAEGNIDLFDFDAQNALATINKSCYDLHKGKTWSDVTIGFSTTVKATLCNVKIETKK